MNTPAIHLADTSAMNPEPVCHWYHLAIRLYLRLELGDRHLRTCDLSDCMTCRGVSSAFTEYERIDWTRRRACPCGQEVSDR
jgi:hypothetical protein